MLPVPTAPILRALTLVVVFFGLAVQALAIPAFPGAEGYGGYAKGGRGGDVYIVTNLNASGAGSFAEGIATVPSAGRTIVFAVSGHIHINGLRLTGSKVTIAGQTAPGDGVGLKDGTFRISSDDVVVRHLRFRHRKSGSGGDCLNLDSGSINSIFDSISMQFSTDENFSSFNSPPENMTMQWSLNAWGLESHSCGGLWDQNHATAHHTLWAHHHTRNPKARPSGLLEWINNVTFDWDIGFIMGDTQTPATYKANVIGSYFLAPAGNARSKALQKATVDRNGSPNFSVHLGNNRHDSDGDGLLNGTDKGYTIVEGSEFVSGDPAGANRYVKSVTPFSNAGAIPVTTDDPVVAFKKVVSKAGALRLDVGYSGPLRDEVDTKLINNLVTQTRNHISNESQLGLTNGGIGTLNSTAAPVDTDKDGMPDYYETALGWNPAAQDHNTALANSGGFVTGTTFLPPNTPAGAGALEKYTRLEEYLHFLAIPHGTLAKNVAGSPTSIAIDMRKFTSGFSSSPTFAVANISGGTIALSGTGNAIATFTPTLNSVGRARFDFTVTDSIGHAWTQTCGLVVTNAGLPRDLVWKGVGNVWDGTAPNWLRPSTGATVAFSFGDRVAFDQGGIAQPNVSVSGTQSAGSVDVDAAGNYTFSGTGAIASSGELTKRGAGTLTLSNTGGNTFTAAALDAGTLTLTAGGALGSAPLALNAGTLNLTSGSQLFIASPLAVNAPVTINASGANHESNGAWTGSGTFNLNTGNTFTLTGNTTAFAGRIHLGASTGFLRLNGSLGSPLATFDLGTGTADLLNRNGNVTIELGGLIGGSGTALTGAGSVDAPTTYVIGATGDSTTFAGTIANGSNAARLTNITKTGSGTLTLGGANTYTGATAVNSGQLLVDGSLGATAVTVASGALLGGDGTLGGALNTSAGAFVSPGTAPFTGATLTANGGLSFNAPTLYFDLSSSPAGANDKIVMGGGTMGLIGAQNFQFLLLEGTLAAGDYDLITGGATTSSSGVTFTHNLPATSRQTFAITRSAAGAGAAFVRLTVTGNPATLTWTGGGANATWDTTTATNWTGGSPSTFGANDAVVFDDTSAVNAITIAASVAPRSVLVDNTTRAYSFGGAAITGGASLTKSGSGALTLTAANSYTGATTINAGATVTLANETANGGALGTGPITLNGGTITMFSATSGFSGSTLNLVVPAGQTGTLNADARHDIYGTLTGGGTFTFRVPWIRTGLFADWSAFTGQLNVITDGFNEPGGGANDSGEFRMESDYSFAGFPAATVNLGAKVVARYEGILAQGAGTSIDIGALDGHAQATLLGGPASSGARALTYYIGGRGTDATFAGTIAEQDTAFTTTAFVKRGAGIWTLSGMCAWNGGTTVEAGTLRVSGSLTSNGGNFLVLGTATLDLANGTLTTSDVQITENAKLTGRGTITGDLSNAGTVTCGAGGTLTVTGDVVNDGTMRFTGGAQLTATGAFVNNGLLDLLTSPSALPANFQNNGIVLDRGLVKVTSATKTGNSFTVTVASFSAHTYQLLRGDSLAGPWNPIGAVQNGSHTVNGDGSITPAILTFTDTGATGAQRFYRVSVGP